MWLGSELTRFIRPLDLKRPPLSARHPTSDFESLCSADSDGVRPAALKRRLGGLRPSEGAFPPPLSTTSLYTYVALRHVCNWPLNFVDHSYDQKRARKSLIFRQRRMEREKS